MSSSENNTATAAEAVPDPSEPQEEAEEEEEATPPTTALVVLGDSMFFQPATNDIICVTIMEKSALKTALNNTGAQENSLETLHLVVQGNMVPSLLDDATAAEAIPSLCAYLKGNAEGEFTVHLLVSPQGVQPTEDNVDQVKVNLVLAGLKVAGEAEQPDGSKAVTALKGEKILVKEEEDLAAQVEQLSLNQPEKLQNVPNASDALKTLAQWILQDCNQVLVLSGAGVSVAAGIPDFRTPGTGLYDNLQKYNLPFPEAVFDVNFYQRNPQPFCSLAKEIWPGFVHSPTLTHTFMTLLHQKNKLLRVYTQNIDGLEVLAELPPERIVECHGHFRSATCTQCKRPAEDMSAVIESITQHAKVPICTDCSKKAKGHGYIKPDIVFFGESLPNRFHTLLKPDLNQADLVLVLGTSLQVAPVSMIPQMVDSNCKRALLNRELVGDFNTKKAIQDVFHPGDCDDSIITLCQLLGWYDELVELNTKTKIVVDKTAKAAASTEQQT